MVRSLKALYILHAFILQHKTLYLEVTGSNPDLVSSDSKSNDQPSGPWFMRKEFMRKELVVSAHSTAHIRMVLAWHWLAFSAHRPRPQLEAFPLGVPAEEHRLGPRKEGHELTGKGKSHSLILPLCRKKVFSHQGQRPFSDLSLIFAISVRREEMILSSKWYVRRKEHMT